MGNYYVIHAVHVFKITCSARPQQLGDYVSTDDRWFAKH